MADSDKYLFHQRKEPFRLSLMRTSQLSGFRPELIEKDYYCSLILMRIYANKETPPVFKGGTSLSKCHTEFFRMSEDLDFMVPMSPGTPRSRRSNEMKGFKEIWKKEICIPPFSESIELVGHNSSLQYIGELTYESAVSEKPGVIKLEIGLREELVTPLEWKNARTVLVDSLTLSELIAPFPIKAFSLSEAYAEKMRAALTRKEPAIRDYFDLDYADRALKFSFYDDGFLKLVRRKLSVPGNDPIDISDAKYDALRMQVDGALKPVLRAQDFEMFKLNRIFKMVCVLGRQLLE